MIAPDIPSDEAERLRALAALGILDTPPEPGFEAVVHAAATLIGAPVALVSLVDAHRQWFKARIGLEVEETPRDISFCGHAVLGLTPLVVDDSWADERFAGNPLTLGETGVRAYLGAPIRDPDGRALGTLCVIDHRPRPWTADHIAAAEALARVAGELIRERTASLASRELAGNVARLTGEIARHRQFLDEVTSLAQVGGWEVDLRTGQPHWNQQTRRMHEVADDFEPDLNTAIDFYAPEARPAIREAVEAGVASGQPWDLELPFITAKGRSIWVRAVGKPIVENGVVTRLVGAFQDVTERRQEREKLVQTLAAANAFFEVSLDLLCVVTTEGKFLRVNRPFETTLGYSAGDLETRTFLDLLHPEDVPAALEQCGRLARGEPVVDFVVRYRRADGVYRWIEWRASPSGTRVLAAARDITDRLRQTEELERKHAEADAANAAKSRFLASMSHEIRTPLNGVIGLAGALARTPLDPVQEEMVDLIDSSGRALDRLLSDVLDLSRAEADKLQLWPEPIDLVSTVEDAAALMRGRADEKGLDFHILYSAGARGRFLADPVRVRQIVWNLTSNAVKFTHSGRIEIRVDVTDAPSGSTLRLEVEDTGIGFSGDAAARLFERFEQADASIHSRFGGTGLGLAICREICRTMGGDIRAASTPGMGSTFTVTAPIRRIAGADPAPAPPAPALAPAQLRVLLAEDHPVNQRVFSLMLQPLAAEVVHAVTGAEAVDLYRSGPLDLVLMDLEMPDMDGLTAIRLIRDIEVQQVRPRTPIVVVTAHTGDVHEAAALEAGADVYLAKPVTLDAFIGALREALGVDTDPAASSGAA